jgi:hypothetical protein
MAEKRKMVMFYMMVLVCLLVMFWTSFLLLRITICKGKIMKSARQYVEMFFPPADLYRPVLDEKINIVAIGQPYAVKFKLKYIGHYAVDIALNRSDNKLYGTEYDLKMRIKINIYKDKVLLFSVSPTDKYNKLWVSSRGEGVTVCQFVSPEQIPIDTNITCEVIILAADPYLASYCKEPSIVIHRQSEE